MKLRPEEKLDKAIKEITARVFRKFNPIKKFPDDFIDEQVKKNLGYLLKAN